MIVRSFYSKKIVNFGHQKLTLKYQIRFCPDSQSHFEQWYLTIKPIKYLMCSETNWFPSKYQSVKLTLPKFTNFYYMDPCWESEWLNTFFGRCSIFIGLLALFWDVVTLRIVRFKYKIYVVLCFVCTSSFQMSEIRGHQNNNKHEYQQSGVSKC